MPVIVVFPAQSRYMCATGNTLVCGWRAKNPILHSLRPTTKGLGEPLASGFGSRVPPTRSFASTSILSMWMALHPTAWGSGMSAEMRSVQRFPTPCTRCGGVLYHHVAFCPYCGVNQPIGSDQRKRAEAPLRAVAKQAPHPAVAANDADESPSPEIIWSSFAAVPAAPGKRFFQWPLPRVVTGSAIAMALMLALGGAAYLRLNALHRNANVIEPTATAMKRADLLSSSSVPPGANAQPSNAGANAPGTSTPLAASAVPVSAQYGKGVPAALNDARASLAQKNLTAAKAAISEVLSVAPRNDEAMRLQGDIAERESERDVALRVAATCANDGLWSCVVKQANQALAIDSSSKDAQILLERAIVSTGWRPLSTRATAAAPKPARRDPPRPVAKSVPPIPTLPTLSPPLPPGIPADNATPGNG
ncbi:hypothetical protein [Paraburkholderia sabiae]|uniref:hypothetical protein n=1 Tax=Paraburkholderia sabiae TaxID=273251 RepID=UPI001CC6A497|nr:hypothetical protein [Paraburkholderia sabiae]